MEKGFYSYFISIAMFYALSMCENFTEMWNGVEGVRRLFLQLVRLLNCVLLFIQSVIYVY